MLVQRAITHYWSVDDRKLIEKTHSGKFDLGTAYGYTVESLLQLRAAIDAVIEDERHVGVPVIMTAIPQPPY